MKKGLFLGTVAALSLLLSTQVLAETPKQTWQIKFKKFIYVWINTDNVVFDFTASGTDGEGVLAGKTVNDTKYLAATEDNLALCAGLDQTFSEYAPSGEFVGTSSRPEQVSGKCHYAPTKVEDNDKPNYSANYDSDGDGQVDAEADTDLLIAALGIDYFQVAKIHADDDGIPDGVTLLFFPGAADKNGLVKKKGGEDPTTPAKLTKDNDSAEDLNWTGKAFGYYVKERYYLYLLPVSHGLELDPAKLDLKAFDSSDPYNEKITITYTVAAF